MTVTFFIPCFVVALYPRAGISRVEILERLGHTVVCPESIAGCGQLPFNSNSEAGQRVAATPRRRYFGLTASEFGFNSGYHANTRPAGDAH